MSSTAQTSAFVKKLAANDRPTRDAALQSLRNYLSSSKTLPLLEYEKLWKGLFYSMWFCDRPRPQQRLAQALGELFSITIPVKNFAVFLEAFYVVILKEWPSIDQWRMDKMYMLIRRVVMHSTKRLQLENWDTKLLKRYLAVLEKVPLSGDKKYAVAIPYHLCDIYVDELEKVIFEDVDEDDEERKAEILETVPVKELISPFVKLNKSALLKDLRIKIKQEILEDERLIQWGAVEQKSKPAAKDKIKENEDEAEAEDGSDSDDDWNGFA